ncbi:hypothetical protein ES705_21152 [subsurface metagenome]
MEIKINFTIIFFITFWLNSSGQSKIDSLLNQVIQNNEVLKANRKYQEAQSILYKTGLTPANPRLAYGYFPGDKVTPGRKETFDLIQSFDFPTTYVIKKNVSDNQVQHTAVMGKLVRQDILLKAELTLFELIYLQKVNFKFIQRKALAERLLKDFQRKMDHGDASRLDLNKARLEFLLANNNVRKNQSSIDQVIEKLTQMNGGFEPDIGDLGYPDIELHDLDSIIKNALNKYPDLEALRINKLLALNMVKLQKSKSLPSFEMGYGSEVVPGEHFRGIRIGLTIPLWENKNKVKQARVNAEHTELQAKSRISELISIIKQNYYQASSLKLNFEDYKKTISQSKNQELLGKALELGQISSIEYFMEIRFFYQLIDKYLELEKKYFQMLAQLYQYEL